MGQAGYQGSKGDKEYGRKEHVGAAEWTGSCLGRGQPVPTRDQGTVLVDLLETFGKNKYKTLKAQSWVFSNAPDHSTLQKTDESVSSNFKARPLHPAMGCATIPTSPSRLPGHSLQQSFVAPPQDLSSSSRPPCLPCQKGSTPLLHLSGSYSIAAASTKQGALCFVNHLFYSPLVWEWKN